MAGANPELLAVVQRTRPKQREFSSAFHSGKDPLNVEARQTMSRDLSTLPVPI